MMLNECGALQQETAAYVKWITFWPCAEVCIVNSVVAYGLYQFGVYRNAVYYEETGLVCLWMSSNVPVNLSK